MYGTVARMRIKPGSLDRMNQLMQEYETLGVPGYRGSYVYQMDGDPDTYFLAVMFDDKASYMANAASPEQDARYQEYRSLLESDPEWHDGEIVYGHMA
jgi:antibiotic biosynthesis monooxygenase (ABM) superfamily enzyme